MCSLFNRYYSTASILSTCACSLLQIQLRSVYFNRRNCNIYSCHETKHYYCTGFILYFTILFLSVRVSFTRNLFIFLCLTIIGNLGYRLPLFWIAPVRLVCCWDKLLHTRYEYRCSLINNFNFKLIVYFSKWRDKSESESDRRPLILQRRKVNRHLSWSGCSGRRTNRIIEQFTYNLHVTLKKCIFYIYAY